MEQKFVSWNNYSRHSSFCNCYYSADVYILRQVTYLKVLFSYRIVIYEEVFRFYCMFIFLALMIATIVVCVQLCSVLKQHYSWFYKKEGYFIKGVTSILVISLLARIGYLLYRTIAGASFDTSLDENAYNNGWIMPIYFISHFIFCDFFTCGSLLLCFAFALSNK